MLTLSLLLTVTGLRTVFASTDYIHEGDSLVSSDSQQISKFITYYKANNSNFSSLQKTQIESQYESIQQTLAFLKGKIDKNSNAAANYQQLTTGIYFNEAKLPMLYSEIFLAHATQAQSSEEHILHDNVTGLIASMTDTNKKTATGIQTTMQQDQSQISKETLAISADFDAMSTIQTTQTDQTKIQRQYADKVNDLETNQKHIISQAADFTQNFQTILSLKAQ